MLSNSAARKSVDSLSPTGSLGTNSEFPFHRRGSHSPRRLSHRRGSTTSTIHSIGGTLDTSSTHVVFEIGQNAISTLLQPPIVRTGLLPHTSSPASSSHKPPTSKDIPPVTLTNIPQVDAAEFKDYLSQVGPLYEQLRRLKESEDEDAGYPSQRGSRSDEAGDAFDDGRLKPGRRPGTSRKSSSVSLSSLSSTEAPSPGRRSSSSFNRRALTHGPPPLSTIPNVYFEEDFHLENPRTFDVVSERSDVVQPAPGTDGKAATNGIATPRKALATNAILQEKLSWYMDTVEMHLIQSISTASTTFFTALGALRELHSEAADSVERIQVLRKELGLLDEEIATSGLTIVQQRRRRENLRQLHDAVLQLREIVDSVAKCEALVDAGEIESALDNIHSLEQLIAGEREASGPGGVGLQLRDLRGATALQGVSMDLDTLRLRIGRAYESQFLSILTEDLRRHVEQVSTQEVLMRWTSASMRVRGSHSREASAFPSYLAATGDLRAQLVPVLGGLQRSNHLATATMVYREAVLRQIKNIIRQPLPSSNDDDNESMMSSSTLTGGRNLSQQDKSSILARNLRALEPKDAEELLVTIYIGVAETLRRLTTQAKVLFDIASSLGDDGSLPNGLKSPQLRSPTLSPGGRHASTGGLEAQEEIHKSLDLPNLLGQAVDVAQDKIVKLLRVRSQQSTRLALVWFLRYFTLNLHFANECEAISGRGGTTLKTIVNGHIRDFVEHHRDTEKKRLAEGMDSDKWGARDFGDADKELLDQILQSSTQDAPAWSEGTKLWILHSDQEGTATVSEASQTNGTGKAKTRSAVIESENFVLPNSAILCMHGMASFLHLIVGLQSTVATLDVSTSLIAYLQLFNSRCTQLILGAGATRSAGLKNITTKHLALASQALAFIAALIPHVREFVRRHSGSGANVSTLMGEFDKVRRLYQEHQNSIYDKLVEIMSGRASLGSKKMKGINWDADGTAVHEYMETLVHETTMLYRNLTKHLPEGTVRLIMLPVFRSYMDTFGGALKGAEVQTEAGRDSMLRDIEYFESRLGKIDGFDDTGKYLADIVKAKEVEQPTLTAASTTAAAPEDNTTGEKKYEEADKAENGDVSTDNKDTPEQTPIAVEVPASEGP
ncbi:hypothetical protein VTK73DRAFT_2702 [Phialemonium thermophilum]|uniref:Vacuolar protein sorting-associated protein 54 n=1 Tax=Phialemonium thermophilum TaxID=223376 RepID=A0ABR3X2W8_9PEZI